PNGWLLIVTLTRSADRLFRRQDFPRDRYHHDKTSPRAACHNSPHSDAIRKPHIACANRAAGRGPSEGRARSRRQTQAAAKRPAARGPSEGCAARGTASRRGAATSPNTSAAASCGGSSATHTSAA